MELIALSSLRDGTACGVDRPAGFDHGYRMIAPRYAAITIALDTESYRGNRPEVRRGHAAYILDRLLTGQEVADIELERLGWRVTVREALKPEIIAQP